MSQNPSDPTGVNRREVLAGLLGGGLGALAGPTLAHPIHVHLADPATVATARGTAQAAGWAPEFLSPHQSATLEAVAERLVPGSTAAKANRFVDKLLTVEKQETQRQFLDSLSAFEAAALDRFGRPILRLTDTERDAVLEKLCGTTEPSPHFTNLKTWVSGAYYSSEIGMRELGYTGSGFFQSFPGCTHPGGHE